MTITRWAVSIEFESPGPIDPALMRRMRTALDAVDGIEPTATGGNDRGTGYALATTVIVAAPDAGAALNLAIDRVSRGLAAGGVEYGDYREATVAAAGFDPRL